MVDNSLEVHGYSVQSDLTEQANALFGAKKEPTMAKKVYQLVFAAYDGSTFPFAFWPTSNWNSVDVLSTTLDAIEMLSQNNFTVCVGSCK